MERSHESPNSQDGTRRTSHGLHRHPILKVVLGIAAAIVIVGLIVPFFVNVNSFKPQIESQLSSALGRKVTLGKLTLSLFSGSLVANDISIADDAAFSAAPFLEAKSLHVGIHVVPLLMHHQLEVTHLIIDSPAIQLIHAASGKWNFSSLGGSSPSASSNPSSVPDLSVAELKIQNGRATVSAIPATGKALTYTAINFDAQQMSFARNFPFHLSADLPAGGSLSLKGNAGPLGRRDAADTPFHADLQLKHFDPVAAGVIDQSKGISMVVDLDAQLASDGNNLTSSGKIKAAHLQLARTGSPTPNPVDMDYSVSQNLDTRTGQVKDIALHTGNVAVHVTGGYRLTPEAVVLDLRLAAPNLPVDQVVQLLPAAGVRLPSGSSLHGGTLTANLSITGPATASTIAGPVEIDNTTLAGFDLGSKIQGLNASGGSSGGTAIQTLRASVNSSPQTTQFTNIYASVPQIGTANGNGTVSPSGALNFSLTAKLSSTSGVGALASQASKQVGGFFGSLLQGAVGTAQKSGIPLTVTGTASNPSIRANLGAMLR